jgi:lipopolysaccharide biosynthesis glycosyltransferase
MPPCCICYTSDPSYLLPTFVSAVQARAAASVEKADVAIISFDADAATERVFKNACDAEGILFVPAASAMIDGANAMLARLFLTRLVPKDYQQLLYIDGDTQIRGSLDALIDAPVPAGHFMAATDPMTFEVAKTGRQNRRVANYFRNIGLPLGQTYSYFNSGVLRISRDGWDEIGQAAWAMFRQKKLSSRFPDQDVLNIVGATRQIPMSLAWNFPIFLRNSRVENTICPIIYHFMGNPKPWQGVFLPWNNEIYKPYVDIVRKYPELASYLRAISGRKRLKYFLQQHYKKQWETFTWGFSARRLRILSYESDLAISHALPR